MYTIIKEKKRRLFYFLGLLIFTNLFLTLTTHKVSAQVYINNFEKSVGKEWSKSSIDKTPNGNLSFLGQFGSETVSLKLKKDTAGNVTISFDLYLINSWDGNDKEFGPDIWKLDIVGGSTLIQTTFSNLEENDIKQSFPNPAGQGNNNAGAGSIMYDTLGYTYYGDSVYHFSFNFNHKAGDIIFNFTAANLQGIGDESWGIDNIKVQGAYAGKDDEIEKEPLNPVKIGKLHISYYEWELNQAILKGELENATEELMRLDTENQERIDEVNEYTRQLEIVNGKLVSIGEEIYMQYQELDVFDDNLKNRKYKRIEARIISIKERMIQINERVDYIKQNVKPVIENAIIELVKEYELLKEKLEYEQNELNKLKEKLGINEVHQKKLDLIKKNEDIFWGYKRQIINIETDKSIANSLQGLSLERYLNSNKRYDDAYLAYNKLQQTGSPLITDIKNDYYNARLWTPNGAIKELDEKVEKLNTHLKAVDKIRTKFRYELIDNAWIVDKESNQLIFWSWLSMLSQAGVEVLDFGHDIYMSSKKAGFFGVAAKTVEKALTLAVFGTPTYYDAKYDISDQFAMKYIDGEKKVVKKIKKTVISHPFKVLVEGYINTKESETLEIMYQSLTNNSWLQNAIGKRDIPFNANISENISKLVDDQSKLLLETEKAFRTSIGQMGKMQLGKKLGINLLKGLAKDTGKLVLKKQLAEYFEGDALNQYMTAQYNLSGSARLLLQASNTYWTSKDAYESLRDVRNLLIEKYDPDNQMLIEYSNTKTYSEEYEDYHIYLSDRDGDSSRASNREIEVTLGGVKAKRHSNGSLHFIIPAEKVSDIKSDSDGAYLEIKVVK